MPTPTGLPRRDDVIAWYPDPRNQTVVHKATVLARSDGSLWSIQVRWNTGPMAGQTAWLTECAYWIARGNLVVMNQKELQVGNYLWFVKYTPMPTDQTAQTFVWLVQAKTSARAIAVTGLQGGPNEIHTQLMGRALEDAWEEKMLGAMQIGS